MFFLGFIAGAAVMGLISNKLMEDISETWKAKLEAEVADHAETSKTLQETRASWAAGFQFQP
jgi:hypothetical protein